MDQEHSARYTDRPGTPEAARAALELAMKPGPNSAYPVEVNLSRLTDELRARGVTITVGRGDRPAAPPKSLAAATALRPAHGGYPVEPERGEESHAGPVGLPGRPAAAERNRHGAEFDIQVVVSGASFTVSVTAFELISTVIAKALRLAGVPDRVRYLGWTLRTDDGTELDREAPIGSSAAVAAKTLFLDPAVGGGGALADGTEVVSLSARKARGDRRPSWWGETPAEGTRRRLIGDVLRAEDVLSESEIREFADAIELALIEVEGKAIDSDRYRGPAKGREAGLEAALAECFRLTGADPDGASDAMLASEAVEEVRRLRREYDELEARDAGDGVPIKHPTLTQVDTELWLRRGEVINAGHELDRISIPRAEDGVTLTLVDRCKLVMQRYTEALSRRENPHIPAEYRDRLETREGELRIVLEDVSASDQPPEYRFIELEAGDGGSVSYPMVPSAVHGLLEVLIPPLPDAARSLTAQGLLTAAQKLSEDEYRRLERALAWDVEDVAAVPDDDYIRPESIALTERSGRRIARALETLSVATGGALRELLDRTATDRESR